MKIKFKVIKNVREYKFNPKLKSMNKSIKGLVDFDLFLEQTNELFEIGLNKIFKQNKKSTFWNKYYIFKVISEKYDELVKIRFDRMTTYIGDDSTSISNNFIDMNNKVVPIMGNMRTKMTGDYSEEFVTKICLMEENKQKFVFFKKKVDENFKQGFESIKNIIKKYTDLNKNKDNNVDIFL